MDPNPRESLPGRPRRHRQKSPTGGVRPRRCHIGDEVRYYTAADPVEGFYRGLADNTVAKQIDNLLKADLVICDELGFAPLDLQGTQLLFRFVVTAYERNSLGVASHRPFEA